MSRPDDTTAGPLASIAAGPIEPDAAAPPGLWDDAWNLPNRITWTRLGLSFLVFALLEMQRPLAAAVVFALAAGTDWLDGMLARKYGLSTVLGRILDPFVDKILVCGSFIYLAGMQGSGVPTWLAVLVVGRELLITALRGLLEGQGENFAASLAGKIKMVLQSVTVPICLVPGIGDALWGAGGWIRFGLVAATAIVTFWSGWLYVRQAGRRMRG